MNIELVRKPSGPDFTEGDLFIDGEWFAFTIEDVVRTGKKVYGKTAIPAGKYKVAATFSNKFKKVMTQILDVPGFEGIRIHQGITAEDSLGCILVSKRRGVTPGVLAGMVAGALTNRLTAMVQAAGIAEIEIK